VKKGKHPTTKRRNAKQRLKDRYAHAREDAQLAGLIPTEPAEALKPERVDPHTQGEQSLPSLDRAAIRNGWAVPDHLKPVLVDRLIEPFVEEPQVVITKDGTPVTIPPDRHLLKENFKALSIADRMQWERDNPEAAGKAKGSTEVNVTNQINFQQLLGREPVVDSLEQQIEEMEKSGDDQPAPSVNGDGRPAQAGGDAVAP
jgi:hypothetical protein